PCLHPTCSFLSLFARIFKSQHSSQNQTLFLDMTELTNNSRIQTNKQTKKKQPSWDERAMLGNHRNAFRVDIQSLLPGNKGQLRNMGQCEIVYFDCFGQLSLEICHTRFIVHGRNILNYQKVHGTCSSKLP
ncbi:hypothetical protein AOLI_G00267070, partial [Acnodon oligacanthus]